ncbi:MAG: peptidoglycan-binding protein [Candidatus Omnitrophica bacterium]|nr:peptidoglycan-binding protein [Candidatus Omnitrophota bacterium]
MLIVVAVFLFSGCATSSKQMDLETQRLRTQIGTLEQQLKDSEKEIEILEIQLERERQTRRNLERQILAEKSKLADFQTLPRPSVRNIQEALRKAGFYDGAVDGKLGPKTKEAIKNFQKSRGLQVDGIVGKATWRELAKYLTDKQK